MASNRPRMGLVLVALVLTLMLAGCDGSAFSDADVKDAARRVSGAMEQQARSVQKTEPVGGTVTAPTGERLTLERVRATLDGVVSPPDGRLVVLDLLLVNPTAAPIPLDEPMLFWVTEISGRRYEPTQRRGIPETLAPGAEARGTLVFAVAADAASLRFGWQRYPLTVFDLP